MAGFEQAFDDTEKAAKAVQDAAMGLARRANALKKAAQTGNIKAIRLEQSKLDEALETTRQGVEYATTCLSLTDDEEEQWFQDEYIIEIKQHAEPAGLRIYEQDKLLISYPSIVRLVPKERAVRIDKRLVRDIRPSHLVKTLQRNQEKSSGYPSQQFIDSLYKVYDALSVGSRDTMALTVGRVIPLAHVYAMMTSRPGSSRDYSPKDFARDIYNLENSGTMRTSKGAIVSFPASTATRRSNRAGLFSFIGQNGEEVTYFGVQFREHEA